MSRVERISRSRPVALRLLLGVWLWPVLAGACTAPKLGSGAGKGEIAAQAQLGSGPQELGVIDPDEANPQGPMSIAVSSDERTVYVLDQQNARIQVFEDDRAVRQIPLPSTGVVDIGLLDEGQIVLMDAYQKGRLFVIDGSGKTLSELPLMGVGVPHPELASALWVRPDGVWVTYKDRNTRLLDAGGAAHPTRPSVSGHPTRDGTFLVTFSVEGASLGILRRERQGMPKNRTATLHFDQPVIHTLGFDSDDAGNLYVVTLHIWGKGNEQQSKTLLTVLSAELTQTKQLTLPTPHSAYEVFRYVQVTGAGSVYFLDLSRSSAKVRRFL